MSAGEFPYDAPVGGFSVADVDPEAMRRVAALGGVTVEQAAEGARALVDAFRPVPLLWQDEGDQA